MKRLLIFALLATALPAQPPNAADAPVGGIQIKNITPFARRDVVTTVLPFAEGTYRGEPLKLTSGPYAGRQLQSAPMGARWPDGSVRFARVYVPVDIAAGTVANRSVAIGQGTQVPFQWDPAVSAGAGRLSIALKVGSSLLRFGPWELLENGPSVNVWRARGRVPGTPFWADVWLEFGSNLPFARFWLHYGDSDPTDPEVLHHVGEVRLIVTGPGVMLRHEVDKVSDRRTVGDLTSLQIEPGSRWCDGESQAMKGILLFAGGNLGTGLAILQWPTFAMADSWESSGAFGPWGYLPGLPPNETPQSAGRRAIRDYRSHRTGPWAWPVLGCLPGPNTTGDQMDFSAMVCTAEAAGIAIERMHAVERSVLREACRPTHYRNADGSPLQTSKIANLTLWHGRPHWRSTIEKLGKSRQVTAADPHRERNMAWWGHDREHWSVNYLTTLAMLTGERWAIEECHHKCELWLSEVRVRSRSPGLNGMGAARDVGRTLQAGSMLWLVTGRDDMRTRIFERITVVENSWVGRNVSPHRPAVRRNPDGRNLGGLYPFAMPWQQAIGTVGLDAVAQTFGDTRARTLADLWALNVAGFGIFPKAGRLQAAKAVEWRGGQWDGWQEYDPQAELVTAPDPNVVEFYDPYMTWMQPGLVIAQRAAEAAGDPTLAQKARDALATRGNGWRSWEWRAIR